MTRSNELRFRECVRGSGVAKVWCGVGSKCWLRVNEVPCSVSECLGWREPLFCSGFEELRVELARGVETGSRPSSQISHSCHCLCGGLIKIEFYGVRTMDLKSVCWIMVVERKLWNDGETGNEFEGGSKLKTEMNCVDELLPVFRNLLLEL
ncbi:hypothetical protein Droror1_Dr00000274, partial [Drosera rotundifolia]